MFTLLYTYSEIFVYEYICWYGINVYLYTDRFSVEIIRFRV